uniref:Uncharacterized protein n=1 Tax=Hyaloperonospora arabidopsidis (strain Emoy2) TaxID=559515 RepID=M4BVF0_HYAAE
MDAGGGSFTLASGGAAADGSPPGALGAGEAPAAPAPRGATRLALVVCTDAVWAF